MKNTVKKIRFIGFVAIVFTSLLLSSFRDNLPKVFVIGDSISIFYGPYLKNSVEGFFNYDRKRDKGEAMKDLDNPIGANGGDSGMVLAYLKELKILKDFKTDYLVLNCGLHDIKRKNPQDSTQVSFKNYKKNILSIIQITTEMKVKLVWINSTPVIDTIHNKRVPFTRYAKDVNAFNKAADSIMRKANIPVIDLYTFTLKFVPEGYQDHVHYNKAIREKQADFIAGNLIAIYNYHQDD